MSVLWAHQEQALDFIHDRWRAGRRGVMLAMEMGCVAGDTEIILNRGGNATRTTLRELHRKAHDGVWNPDIPSRTKSLIDGELRLNRILDVMARGVQPVLRITLASGKSIRVTADHEIAVPGGSWLAAASLTPGMEVWTNGQPACRICGSLAQIATNRGSKYRGVCRPCIYRLRPKRLRTKEKIIDKDGYIRLYHMHGHPRANRAGQVYEHLIIMENIIGRPIRPDEHIHHKNLIRHDNRPENLELLPGPAHRHYHGKHGHYLHLDKAVKVCFVPRVDTVASVVADGETDVYDLVMADPGHNFVANGIIVHNCGKSRVAIEAAITHALDQILILCPLRVVEVWERQFRQFAPDYAFLALDDRAGSVASKLIKARAFIAWADERRQPAAIAINYESARLGPFSTWALGRTWPLVIADECVPPGSMITTPAGKRPIEDLHEGDTVIGYDHQTRSLVETRVTATFRHKTTAPLLNIKEAQLTPEHPVWTTNRGYVPARFLRPDDEVLLENTPSLRMPMVSDALRGLLESSKVLQPQLRLKIANGQSGKSSAGRDGLSDAEWGQRPQASATATSTGSEIGLADGVDHTDTCQEGLRLSHTLQARHCRPGSANCHRSRWLYPPIHEDSRGRRPERQFPNVPRLVGSALLELGNPKGSGWSREPHPVHNLETETGNYFVNGLLVHNCHRLKSNSGRTSRFVGRVALFAQHRLALTGTPMPHNPLDVWAQYRFVDRSVFDVTYTSFKARHAIMGGFYGKQVVNWRDLDELRQKFFSLAFQVGAEVLDLPPELDETYHTDLTAAGAKTCRALEEDFIAWLESGEVITIKNALVKLLRLQQLTGGTLPDDSGEEHQVDTSKEILLEDLLEDIAPDEPVVVFCRFRADLNAVKRVASRLERPAGELSGTHSDLTAWQRGRPEDPKILAVQIQAGGVGIDLTRARYGVYYSLGFSLADYLQSRARIRRPGQTRPVTYYHLIVRNTVDVHVMRALEARQDLIESVLQQFQKGRKNVAVHQ